MFISRKTRLTEITEFTRVTIVLELSTTCTVNTIYLEEYFNGCKFISFQYFITSIYVFGITQD